MSEEVMIRVKGLKKSYQIIDASKVNESRFFKKKTEYPVFENINLEVRKGDILGILGRNGCGKSTFLKIVSQIIEPDEGTVEVFGKVASILELSMGFHGDLSGRDNIILRSELYGIPREKVLENLDSIIEYSDLGVYIDNPVRTYSSGMKSRLAFSVMVNVDADIFLVDEALSTGDMAFASKASEHLKDLVRSGKTVLFTSHSMNTIKRTCNRAVWISDRTIKMDGPADEIVDEYSRS
ncbi:MAG: ABC transporter ATP-binding protein, partial [Candidatus Methanomethylophilaceae archaeon]|nr:ABC transporter ATP-binding protein [Candidatus Methanomethylophilaceae archaeon]